MTSRSLSRLAVPLSVVLCALVDLLINVGVLFVFVLAAGIPPRLEWLELVPLMGLLALFTTGVTLLLSSLYALWQARFEKIDGRYPTFSDKEHVP